MVAATEDVEQRPVVKALVAVVGAVAGHELVTPDQRAVVAGVFLQHRVDRLVHGGDELSLERGPGR